MNTCVICGAPSPGVKKNGSAYKCCPECRAKARGDAVRQVDPRPCELCGELLPDACSRRTKYCSYRCRQLATRGADCAGCGKRVHRSRTSGDIQFCLECRRGGVAPTAHGASGYRRGCRCDVCRAGATARHRMYVEEFRAEHGAPPPRRPRRRKPCGWCGVTHEDASRGEGQTHVQWLRHHVPSPSRELTLYVPEPEPPTVEPIIAKRPFVAGECAWCRASFVSLIATRTCSTECSRGLRRLRRGERHGGFSISLARRRAIYERDNFTCQICFEPTSAAWACDDPWSPTLDHIVPQSSSSTPDHSDENLRVAHALCNSYRRDGAVSDQEVRELVRGRRELQPR